MDRDINRFGYSILTFIFYSKLNFGIDFRGGTSIRTESSEPIDVADYRSALSSLDLGDITISEVFDPNFADDQNVAMIRIQAQLARRQQPLH